MSSALQFQERSTSLRGNEKLDMPESASLSEASAGMSPGPSLIAPGLREQISANIPGRSAVAFGVVPVLVGVAAYGVCWIAHSAVQGRLSGIAPLPAILHSVTLACLAVVVAEALYLRRLGRDIAASKNSTEWANHRTATTTAPSASMSAAPHSGEWPISIWSPVVRDMTNPGVEEWSAKCEAVRHEFRSKILGFDLGAMAIPSLLLLLGGLGMSALAFRERGTTFEYPVVFSALLIGFAEGTVLLVLALIVRYFQTGVDNAWAKIVREHAPETSFEPSRTDQHRADQHRADQHQANQHQADQHQADQHRTEPPVEDDPWGPI